MILRKQIFGRWLGKGFWAVTDQGLFASSNFVLSILLARWLAPQGYGAFTVVYTVFWLVGTFHTAFFSEPMLVFGSGKYRTRLSEYSGILIYGSLGFTVLGSLLFLLVSLGLKFGNLDTLSSGLLGLALASPFVLFQWLMRRACYAHLKPHLAALGGAVYMALMLAGAYILYWGGLLSSATAFGLMGFVSLLSGLLITVSLRVSLSLPAKDGLASEAIESHWRYGRWVASIGVLIWISSQTYYLVMAALGGLETTAALRAVTNIVLPAQHVYTALSTILVAALVQFRESTEFGRLARLALIVFVLTALVYWATLGLLHGHLVTWLYGGQYSEYSRLLWLLGLLPLFTGIEAALGAVSRALERPDHLFWAYAFSTVVSLTAGVGLTAAWGITGAAVGLCFSYGTIAGVITYTVIRRSDLSQN